MIYRITFLVLIISCSTLSGQEFITELFLENSEGLKDTVYIGYDPMASTEIDTQFGEIDITSDSLSGLGVRLSRTNVFDYDYDYEYWNEEDFPNIMSYQSKVDVLKRDCSDDTIDWAPPFSTILIPVDQLPLVLSWDNSQFQNDCIGYSFLTSYPYDAWWHLPSFSVYHLPFDPNLLLSENSSLLIEKPSGHMYINEYSDTLMMLFVNFNADATILTSVENPKLKDVIIYPNPSHDVLHVFGDENLMRFAIHNMSGRLVRRGAYKLDGVDIRNLDAGSYVLLVTNKNGESGSVLFEKR